MQWGCTVLEAGHPCVQLHLFGCRTRRGATSSLGLGGGLRAPAQAPLRGGAPWEGAARGAAAPPRAQRPGTPSGHARAPPARRAAGRPGTLGPGSWVAGRLEDPAGRSRRAASELRDALRGAGGRSPGHPALGPGGLEPQLVPRARQRGTENGGEGAGYAARRQVAPERSLSRQGPQGAGTVMWVGRTGPGCAAPKADRVRGGGAPGRAGGRRSRDGLGRGAGGGARLSPGLTAPSEAALSCPVQ